MNGRETKPTLTILHELPGRIRVSLSHPIAGKESVAAALEGHAGVENIEYTPITRSVLLRFRPDEVTREEIVVRVALALALDNGGVPVRILAEPEDRSIAPLTLYSGLLLLGAAGSRIVAGSTTQRVVLEWLAGLTTLGAVADHGWEEFRRRGHVDPEVLSAAYLVAAMLRGNLLPAAFVTWVTTFGRHLVRLPKPGVQVRAIEIPVEDGEGSRYEVEVTRDAEANANARILGLLPATVMKAVIGGAEPRNMLEEIRNVSQMHGEVLEGIGGSRHGIPVWIR